MVAYMAMAAQKEKEENHVRDAEVAGSRWEQWKRGGIIGAAALTGGTLLAITGGTYRMLLSLLKTKLSLTIFPTMQHLSYTLPFVSQPPSYRMSVCPILFWIKDLSF